MIKSTDNTIPIPIVQSTQVSFFALYWRIAITDTMKIIEDPAKMEYHSQGSLEKVVPE